MAMKDIYEALAKQEEARILDVVKTEQDQFGFKKVRILSITLLQIGFCFLRNDL